MFPALRCNFSAQLSVLPSLSLSLSCCFRLPRRSASSRSPMSRWSPSLPWWGGSSSPMDYHNINRVGSGVLRLTENGSMRVPTLARQRAASPGVDEQVHDLELGAYNVVLKAFIAQSDDVSWGKEKLISQLRKELRVSDVEHRESLATVDADELGMEKHVTSSPSAKYMPRLQSLMAVTSSHLTAASPNYVPRVQSSTAVVHPSQWGEDAYVNQGNEGQCVKYMGHGGQLPVAAEGVMEGVDRIEIRETHVIIDEVERVFTVENPNLSLIQKAKMILKEHEQSLLESISNLYNMSDIGP